MENISLQKNSKEILINSKTNTKQGQKVVHKNVS